ncbi:MAG TPA: hypothetical protein VM689_18890 [Aliidongia sp.]|nr:hypothetical protein [Aliidongia sp.]
MPQPDAASLVAALRPPARVYFEPVGVLRDCMAGSTLRLSLLTPTAYDLPLGEIVAGILLNWIPVPSPLRFSIATVVDEATINAIVHGNLAISSRCRGSVAGLGHLDRQLASRLADPAACAKRCDIRIRWNQSHIFLRVSDEGHGFTFQDSSDSAAAHGRGRSIIRALTATHRWVRGGRTLALKLAR